jgi:hypothetical protein
VRTPCRTWKHRLELAATLCLLSLCAPALSHAQSQTGKPPAYQDPAYQPPAQQPYNAPQQPYAQQEQQPNEDALSWMPQGMTTLSREASSHTDFTFDRSMLALAGNLYGLDAPTRQSLGRLNGISVHSYRFPGRAYDPGALEAVRAQYNALGWKHVVSSKSHPGTYAQNYGNGQTDLWIETRGMDVAGAAILLASPSSVNLIAVSGDLSTVDLLRLRGHFGIPRFDGSALPPMH